MIKTAYTEANAMIEYDLAIIGGGPGGLTASIYGSRAGLKTLVLEKVITGGQMRLTSGIENYPGFPNITGEELSKSLHQQAMNHGAEILSRTVKSIVFEDFRKIIDTDEESFGTKTIIIATGTRHNNIDCPGAREFAGRGLSFCALCDGAFMRNEVAAVVGGGNSALEEADYLSRFATKVYLIHRRDEFRADKHLRTRILDNPKVEFIPSAVVARVSGSDIVEEIEVKSLKTGEITPLKVGGVFVYVGNSPNTAFLPPEIKTNAAGYILTDDKLETSVPGVYAAGDVRDTDLRQIVTAVADGARAAVNANRRIEETPCPELGKTAV
ncbi:MAG: thioredoxin-disulfide reductase [Deltaproteobacteria bacterium]|nr:thioredoxin-disulfide reductase [Deltaproteobacteria bacterium]